MKTIQITVDESLLEEMDRVIARLNTTRSAFIRDALQAALREHGIAALERQHAQGYALKPSAHDEFDLWSAEHVWNEE